MRHFLGKSLAGIGLLATMACTPNGATDSGDTEIIARAASGLELTRQDEACLREAIYHEARAKDLKGGQAVAHVILNRAQDPRFPNTVCGVIAEGQEAGRCQFSYRCDGRPETFPDKIKLEGAEEALDVVLADPDADVTSGALFFHAEWMRPGWFATLRRTVTLGGHIFYR